MGKLLAAAAVLIGVYAIYDSQRAGAHYRLGTPGALIAPTGTPGTSVAAAANGLAGRVGN